jgi:hypothetical protein
VQATSISMAFTLMKIPKVIKLHIKGYIDFWAVFTQKLITSFQSQQNSPPVFLHFKDKSFGLQLHWWALHLQWSEESQSAALEEIACSEGHTVLSFLVLLHQWSPGYPQLSDND